MVLSLWFVIHNYIFNTHQHLCLFPCYKYDYIVVSIHINVKCFWRIKGNSNFIRIMPNQTSYLYKIWTLARHNRFILCLLLLCVSGNLLQKSGKMWHLKIKFLYFRLNFYILFYLNNITIQPKLKFVRYYYLHNYSLCFFLIKFTFKLLILGYY